MTQAVRYTDLADALARLGFSQDAAEYHGALCGALCVQASDEVELDRVVPSENGHAPFGDAPAHQALERVRDESIDALQSNDSIFMPLLPEDSADLAERARALACWCEGFLYGLASRGNLDLGGASPEVREMVSDLVQFSHATSSEDDDEEIEENAYAELVEYIRVGAQLIFMELRPRGAATDPNRQVLH